MQPTELTLEDMLADSIVRQLMDRDGVAEDELRGLRRYATARPPMISTGTVVADEPQSFQP